MQWELCRDEANEKEAQHLRGWRGLRRRGFVVLVGMESYNLSIVCDSSSAY